MSDQLVEKYTLQILLINYLKTEYIQVKPNKICCNSFSLPLRNNTIKCINSYSIYFKRYKTLIIEFHTSIFS